MLLSGYVRSLPGGDVAMWVQAAENAYHGGQYDDALAAYDRAARLARQEGDADQAFQVGFQAATIEHQRGRHAEAGVRYRQLAISLPEQPKAPEAHLLALWHAGQIAAQEPGGSLDEYIALAEEHLATWPGATTADEVHWRLGRAREHRGEWEKAVEQYRAISPGYSGFAEVVEAAARAYEARLNHLRAAGEPTEAIASAAAEWFESLVIGPQGRMPERWSPAAQAAAISAARLWLNYTTTGFDGAERILSAALDGVQDATPEWQSTARALLVFSLAAQGRRHEATKVLEQISAGSAEQLLKMLQGLARIGATSQRRTQGELAELELGVVELLRGKRDQLDPASERALDQVAAQALADSGQTAAALDAYRRLSQAYPEDGEIQEGYARVLLARQDSAATEAALAKWREVETKTPPGTDRWFRAKLALALLHDRSGNPQQAEKILRLIEILHPQPKLRDREVTARFAESLDPAMRAQLFELLGRQEQ
jgi:tetratricopeptide (TPR) repeat protein